MNCHWRDGRGSLGSPGSQEPRRRHQPADQPFEVVLLDLSGVEMGMDRGKSHDTLLGAAAGLPVELDTIITAASTLGAALQRVQSELTLRDSEEKFRSIIEQSSDGILLTDEAGTVIKCNPAM